MWKIVLCSDRTNEVDNFPTEEAAKSWHDAWRDLAYDKVNGTYPAVEFVEYKYYIQFAERGNEWHIVTGPQREATVIARCLLKSRAQQIADLLNKAEGL